MTDLSDLIARLEAATEGSNELDEAIYRHLFSGKPVDPIRRPGVIWTTDLEYCRPYTTSLDAGLPGERIIKTAIDADGWYVTALTDDGRSIYGFGKTEPLARRIAALKARAGA